MAINDFGKFIDDLRESRNFSREDLVEGIISVRQYFRFVNGESSLKYSVLMELLERLGLSDSLSHEYYKKVTDAEYQMLQDVYGALYIDDLQKAHTLFLKIDPNLITLNSNKIYYQFVEQLLGVKQLRWTYEQAAEKILKIVDYPNVLSKDILTYIEKNMLVYLTNYLMKNNDYRIASFFYKIVQKEIEDDAIVDEYSIPFRNIAAKCLGRMGENSKSLHIIKNTENHFIINGNFLPLVHLYYYKALQERELFDDSRYRKSLQNMLSLLNLSEPNMYKEKYQNLIYKTFNLKEQDLIIYK